MSVPLSDYDFGTSPYGQTPNSPTPTSGLALQQAPSYEHGPQEAAPHDYGSQQVPPYEYGPLPPPPYLTHHKPKGILTCTAVRFQFMLIIFCSLLIGLLLVSILTEVLLDHKRQMRTQTPNVRHAKYFPMVVDSDSCGRNTDSPTSRRTRSHSS
jgi:hypothetical protein